MHNNIANFEDFCVKTPQKETDDEIRRHAKFKAKIAKEFVPKLGKNQQQQLEERFFSLGSISAIDNDFRVFLNERA